MSEELKNCPFCGGEAKKFDWKRENQTFVIGCSNFCNMLSELSGDKAIKAWNTRVEPEYMPTDPLNDDITNAYLRGFKEGKEEGRRLRKQALEEADREFEQMAGFYLERNRYGLPEEAEWVETVRTALRQMKDREVKV